MDRPVFRRSEGVERSRKTIMVSRPSFFRGAKFVESEMRFSAPTELQLDFEYKDLGDGGLIVR